MPRIIGDAAREDYGHKETEKAVEALEALAIITRELQDVIKDVQRESGNDDTLNQKAADLWYGFIAQTKEVDTAVIKWANVVIA